MILTSVLDRRGAERMILELALGLDPERFETRVVCLREKTPFLDEFRARGVEVTVLGMNRYLQFRPLRDLYSLLREYRIDLLHTHLYRDAVYGRILARLAGVRGVVSTLHNSYVWRSRGQLLLDRLTAVLADRIVAVSDAVREFAVRREHIPAGKLITIHNGIDTSAFGLSGREREDARKELGLAPGELAIGSMGELTRQKGYKYLLEAVPEVIGRYPAARFFIAGRGDLKDALLARRDELGLSGDVELLGFRSDVPRLLAAFDIFVLPSLWEGLPVALIEAMASGRPIVTTDVDGNCEVIGRSEGAGIAVRPRDPAGLARALIRLIEDPDLRERMGEIGKRRAEDLFSLRGMIEKYARLYTDCLL